MDGGRSASPNAKGERLSWRANWADREVIVDQGLVTSRTPQDIRAFNEKLIEEIADGAHTSFAGSGANAGKTSRGNSPGSEQFGSTR